MADLWGDFLRLRLGAQQTSSLLTNEEAAAISLKNNADIFLTR